MSEFAPGDIVEIETPNGLAYVQVTHRHPSYPEVVRALPGLFAARPADLDELSAARSAFTTMIPLGAAITAGRLRGRRAGAAMVPEADRTFPTFKMAIRDKQGGIAYWWLWDGDGLRYDPKPGPESEAMPQREVLTADALLARLAAMGEGPAHG